MTKEPNPSKPVPVNRPIQNQVRRQTRGRTRQPIKRSNKTWRAHAVGKAVLAGAAAAYTDVVNNSHVPISNNIGVGILSYNRFSSLKRLIESIKQHTDLKRTTVFISDESDNFTNEQKEWLKSQDMCVMLSQPRLGVAGNTNRLLKCLDRFRWKIVLNDDVEILKPGWEHFYAEAMIRTGVQHFCYREPGVYGAKEDDGKVRHVGGIPIWTIDTKPHGAVLAFTHSAFEAVGYFDESFGIYGMEHVDWSTRVARKLGVSGFHDAVGSENFYKIHSEKSVIVDRTEHLSKAREIYARVDSQQRVYINATPASDVPALSVVIPFRDTGRSDDVETVVANMKAQRFPRVETVISEQDAAQRAPLTKLAPIVYHFAPNTSQGQHFNKAVAFNQGVLKTTHGKLVLHDADIIAAGDYLQAIYAGLQTYESCHLGAEVYYLAEGSTNQLNSKHILSPNYECGRIVTYFEGGSLGCTKAAYKAIGGFDENFVGYGVEDCAFYANLKLTKFLDKRSFKFFHLWHNRTPGWEACHQRNRDYYAGVIRRNQSLNTYIAQLAQVFKTRYRG